MISHGDTETPLMLFLASSVIVILTPYSAVTMLAWTLILLIMISEEGDNVKTVIITQVQH